MTLMAVQTEKVALVAVCCFCTGQTLKYNRVRLRDWRLRNRSMNWEVYQTPAVYMMRLDFTTLASNHDNILSPILMIAKWAINLSRSWHNVIYSESELVKMSKHPLCQRSGFTEINEGAVLYNIIGETMLCLLISINGSTNYSSSWQYFWLSQLIFCQNWDFLFLF